LYLDVHQGYSTRKNEESEDFGLNVQSQLNGSVADKNTLLLDFDPEAPPPGNLTSVDTPSPNDPFKQFANISSQQDNKTETLLDFEGSTDDTNQQEHKFRNSSFDSKSSHTDENLPLVPQSKEEEDQLLHQAYDDVDHAAQELASKIDLVSSPSPPPTSARQPPPSFDIEQQSVPSTESKIEEHQAVTSPKLDSTLPTASPAKKPAANAIRPTSATKPKPSTATAATSKNTEQKTTTTAASKSTEHKPAASTTKSTEPKPSTTTRKTIHSAPTAASNKPKVTSTSPTQEASTVPKPTVNNAINLKLF
jgi:hypothetical protein